MGLAPSAPPEVVVGQNLIFNGDGEYDRGFTTHNRFDQYVSGWIDPGAGQNNPRMTLVEYGNGHWLGAGDPGPDDRGVNMFIGGTQADSRLSQTIDVSDLAAEIDAGRIEYELSAYLGGAGSDDDLARFSARFLDADGEFLQFGQLESVSAVDRGNQTALLLRQQDGPVPIGTRGVEVTLVMTRLSGTDNNGFADNLSLVFRATGGPPSDLNGNGFVDFEDLTVLLANWNKNVAAIDGNLVDPAGTPVNFEDLTVLLADWTGPAPGGSPEAALGAEAVPEPSGLVLLALALAGLFGGPGVRRFLRSRR